MSCIKIEGFKYLVVKTGYTSRLVENVDSIEENMADISSCSCEDESEETCEHQGKHIIYIEDNICGTGMYEFGTKDEITHIKSILNEHFKEEHELSGIIVLKCNKLNQATNLVEILMEQNYCSCFGFSNLDRMEILNGEVLLMYFDCESG